MPDPVHQTERRCLIRRVNAVLGRAKQAGQTGAQSVPPHRRRHRHYPGARHAVELERAAAGDDVPGLGPPSVDLPHDLARYLRTLAVSYTEVVEAVTTAVVVVDHRPPEVGGDDLPRPLLRSSRRHACSVSEPGSGGALQPRRRRRHRAQVTGGPRSARCRASALRSDTGGGAMRTPDQRPARPTAGGSGPMSPAGRPASAVAARGPAATLRASRKPDPARAVVRRAAAPHRRPPARCHRAAARERRPGRSR